MSEKPKIRYPAKRGGGGSVIISNLSVGHILWKGGLLCAQNQDDLLKKAVADVWVTRSGVIPGNLMCDRCQEVYKSNGEFPYRKWVRSVVK
jgi:hypothetical protein